MLLLVTSGLSHLPPIKVVTILSGVVGVGLPFHPVLSHRSRRPLLRPRLGAEALGAPIKAFIERRLGLIAGLAAAVLIVLYFALQAVRGRAASCPAERSLTLRSRPAAVPAVLVLSAATVVAAWVFQIAGGYVPCPLCLQQRWAYYAVALVALSCGWEEGCSAPLHPSGPRARRTRHVRQRRARPLPRRHRMEVVAGTPVMRRRRRPVGRAARSCDGGRHRLR